MNASTGVVIAKGPEDWQVVQQNGHGLGRNGS
jgi:hypothetical protein